MREAIAGVPATCPDCGGGWTWRAPWWKSPSTDPVWGYLVHCAKQHFHWFEAEIPATELEEARRRFARSPATAALKRRAADGRTLDEGRAN